MKWSHKKIIIILSYLYTHHTLTPACDALLLRTTRYLNKRQCRLVIRENRFRKNKVF